MFEIVSDNQQCGGHASGTILIVIGSWWKRRRLQPEHVSQIPVMSAWSIWVGGLVLVLVAAISIWGLFTLFGAGNDQDRIGLDIVRLAGSIVAGTGGAAALLLAARRQRATELDLAQKERSASDARYDATERRVTELYTKAVELLGAEKAAVRLAGLYALERLGQDNQEHRQTIVNVVCAYLRIPFDQAMEEEKSGSATGELEVRKAAQSILVSHVRRGILEDSSTFWRGMSLDLSGANLIDFDLNGAVLQEVRFTGAVFMGKMTNFAGTNFRMAYFEDAKFLSSVYFSTAFDRVTRFSGAEFCERVDFGSTKFGLERARARLHPADGAASFEDCTFHRFASFKSVDFNVACDFEGANFWSEADFNGANVRGIAPVSFRFAKFSGSFDLNVSGFNLDGVWIRTDVPDVVRKWPPEYTAVLSLSDAPPADLIGEWEKLVNVKNQV